MVALTSCCKKRGVVVKTRFAIITVTTIATKDLTPKLKYINKKDPLKIVT